MMKQRWIFAAIIFQLMGCSRAYTVNMGHQPISQSHYVVVKTKWNGKMKVFDCQSTPQGDTWEPTCRQVKMQSTLGHSLDDTWTRIRKKE